MSSSANALEGKNRQWSWWPLLRWHRLSKKHWEDVTPKKREGNFSSEKKRSQNRSEDFNAWCSAVLCSPALSLSALITLSLLPAWTREEQGCKTKVLQELLGSLPCVLAAAVGCKRWSHGPAAAWAQWCLHGLGHLTPKMGCQCFTC